MPYATQQQLADRYGARELVQVTDKAQPPTGAVNTATVDRALADADSEIDSRLGLRYAVPLTAPPAIVLDVACRIARYKLHEDRATEKVRNDYQDAIKFLDSVAAGRAILPGVTVPQGDSAEGVNTSAAAVRAPEPVFTGALLERMP